MKAKRLVFPSKLRVEVETFDLPDSLKPGEVMVENLYGLISPGTELAMFTETHVGFPIPDFRYAKFPFRPGYAAVGRVVSVGEGVENLRVGDTVFTRGLHASHAVVSTSRGVSKVPEGVPTERVPFTALAVIAFTSVRLSEARFGCNVAVFGQGLVGNLAAQLMRCAGARQVIGIDTVPERLEIAAKCGVDIQINPARENLSEKIREHTNGAGCQLVVEATGNPEVAPQALKIAAQMGKVILLGSPRGSAQIDLYFDLHRTGVSLIGAHASRQTDATQYGDPEPNELMLEFIIKERLAIAPLITHISPASKAQAAYTGLLNEKDRYLGILLDLRQWN